MDEQLVQALTDTPEQADAVIERARRLGCRPDDIVIEAFPDHAPAGVLVTAGIIKGKPWTYVVARDGTVSLPHSASTRRR